MTGAAPRPSPAPPMAPATSRRWPAPTDSSNCRPARSPFRKVSSRGSSAGKDMSSEKIVPLSTLTQGRAPVGTSREGAPLDKLRRPIHDLRISVMDRCNFRCPYCMPRETFHESYRFLKSSERLDFAELLQLARVFVRAGVKKIRITGGEPLLRPNLADFIGDLSSISGIEDIALTTNGVLLAKYASELKAAGL